MTKVPERKASFGENLNKLRRLHDRPIKQQPTYEEPGPRSKHGFIKVSQTALPHPLKCSKCSYIAKTKEALRLHWLDEH